MDQFNLGDFINKFINYPQPTAGGKFPSASNSGVNGGFQLTNEALAQPILKKNLTQNAVLNTFSESMLAELKVNNLATLERSLYVKDLMNLPKDLKEVLLLIQNKAATAEDASKLLNTNISLSTLVELIQTGGKEAMNKLVLIMANASKQGINDVSQIKDAMKLINASVSVAGQDNLNQVLKNFMLLYLPWLPLQEGVDFELEIESSEGESTDSETTITILISTKNYGNVKVVLIFAKQSSLEIFVSCDENFPKEELLKRLNIESKNHSIQSNITFEQKKVQQSEASTPQAKISMSNLKEVNPFLLLMANAVIRHTIELDSYAG